MAHEIIPQGLPLHQLVSICDQLQRFLLKEDLWLDQQDNKNHHAKSFLIEEKKQQPRGVKGSMNIIIFCTYR